MKSEIGVVLLIIKPFDDMESILGAVHVYYVRQFWGVFKIDGGSR